MASLLVDSKAILAENRRALREYARRVILQGEGLLPREADNQARRMGEFLAICSSLKLTEAVTVHLIFGGMLACEWACDCAVCQAHGSM